MSLHLCISFVQMRGDMYTEGTHILHLDSDVVIFERITYDHIFHLGKPVLPFRRFRPDDSFAGEMSVEAGRLQRLRSK